MASVFIYQLLRLTFFMKNFIDFSELLPIASSPDKGTKVNFQFKIGPCVLTNTWYVKISKLVKYEKI